MYSNRIWDVCLRKLQALSIIKATATHELCPQHTLPLPPMSCVHTTRYHLITEAQK